MAKVTKKSVAPIYLVGVVWLLWGVFGPLYNIGGYLMAAISSLAVYLVAKKIFPDQTFTTAEEEPKEEPAQAQPQKAEEEKKPASTGDPEIDKLVADGKRAVSEMRRLNDSIEDPEVSREIEHLEQVTGKIIDVVVEQPAKLSQIRRFMNYYLPTTLKILNAYDRMDAVGVSGANIDGTKGKVEELLGMLHAAYDKQLDALFGEEALDISTDITVMEQMLAREGIGGMQITDMTKKNGGTANG